MLRSETQQIRGGAGVGREKPRDARSRDDDHKPGGRVEHRRPDPRGGDERRAHRGRVLRRVSGLPTGHPRGLYVEVGEGEVVVDLTVALPYGSSFPEITNRMRRNVIRGIEGMTSLRVTGIDITVNDVFPPGGDR